MQLVQTVAAVVQVAQKTELSQVEQTFELEKKPSPQSVIHSLFFRLYCPVQAVQKLRLFSQVKQLSVQASH